MILICLGIFLVECVAKVITRENEGSKIGVTLINPALSSFITETRGKLYNQSPG